MSLPFLLLEDNHGSLAISYGTANRDGERDLPARSPEFLKTGATAVPPASGTDGLLASHDRARALM